MSHTKLIQVAVDPAFFPIPNDQHINTHMREKMDGGKGGEGEGVGWREGGSQSHKVLMHFQVNL